MAPRPTTQQKTDSLVRKAKLKSVAVRCQRWLKKNAPYLREPDMFGDLPSRFSWEIETPLCPSTPVHYSLSPEYHIVVPETMMNHFPWL